MNRKQLLLALLAGLACAPSAQASDREQKSLAALAGETVGELGSTAHRQARNIYAATAPDAAAWRAYLWTQDLAAAQARLSAAQARVGTTEATLNAERTAMGEMQAYYNSRSTPLPQADDESAGLIIAQAKVAAARKEYDAATAEQTAAQAALEFAGKPTLRQQAAKAAAGFYDQPIPAFTPRQVFEGTQAVATAAATSVKDQVMGLPGTFKHEFAATKGYVESLMPQDGRASGPESDDDSRIGAAASLSRTPRARRNNLTETPLPVAGAWVSTIVLDRALAALGKAFPKLFGTGDEHRKNKVLALMLAGTGVYGSRMSQDDPYAPAQSSTAKTRHDKALLVSVIMAAGTLFANSMRRWLGERKKGEAMPTWMQEVKHALKVLILHYWNIRAAASLRDMGSGSGQGQYGQSPRARY